MKNIKLICAVAGLMACSAPQLVQAEDAKPEGRPNREELREKLKNLTPEERQAKMKEFREKHPEGTASLERRGEEMKKMAKELGLDPEDLKNLPQDERRAKIKAATDKKLAELQKKKTDGSITDAEKTTLEKLEMRKKFMEQRRGEGGADRRAKPASEKPGEKPADK
ncbi:MAG: hypothetical protein ABIP71_10520 [Verrucomicrobiota bacterium]